MFWNETQLFVSTQLRNNSKQPLFIYNIHKRQIPRTDSFITISRKNVHEPESLHGGSFYALNVQWERIILNSVAFVILTPKHVFIKFFSSTVCLKLLDGLQWNIVIIDIVHSSLIGCRCLFRKGFTKGIKIRNLDTLYVLFINVYWSFSKTTEQIEIKFNTLYLWLRY